MRLALNIFALVIVLALVAIQFFQPEKNNGESTDMHIFKTAQIPENVQLTLKNACMDCHSDQTNYLWYHRVAPVSWVVGKHIADGKEELNFSVWGELDDFDKIGMYDDIYKEVKDGTMPIRSYKAMHKNARLSKKEIDALCEWTKTQSEMLTNKINEEL